MPRAPRPAGGRANTRLARLRRARGLKQHELASAIGVSDKTLWRLEHGLIEEPSLRLLVNCALTLRVPVGDLLEPEWREWFVYDTRRPAPPQPSDFGSFRALPDGE